MKFVADGMLGKLTRWLRLAGEDVICINDYPVSSGSEDEFILDLVKEDSRILLTRDVGLHRRAIRSNMKSILVKETGDIAEQLLEISRSVDGDVEINREDSRCTVCNGELEPKNKSQISGEVPETILRENEKFWRCGGCGKIYWPGSHWKKITEVVDRYKKLRG